MNTFFNALVAFVCISFNVIAQNNPADYVNVFIGTDKDGNTFPGASMPFGMVQLSPDAGSNELFSPSGYPYKADTIYGFSHTHTSGTALADLMDISFLPTVKPIIPSSNNTYYNFMRPHYSAFSHKSESAKPGFYSVTLQSHDIKVSLTSSRRCGFQKYEATNSDSIKVLIDLDFFKVDDITTAAHIQIINDTLIVGYRFSDSWMSRGQKVFFATKFSLPIARSLFVDNNNKIVENADSLTSKGIKAALFFALPENKQVLVKTGISSVSIEGAINNLTKELPNWNFNDVAKQAYNEWNKLLNRIQITSDSVSQKTIFYTALYHSLLAPNLHSDVNGMYRGADDIVHEATGFDYYSCFSLWDTYRALHPLLNLIIPEKINADFILTMLAHFKHTGHLPVWTLWGKENWGMIGNHAIPVIADAYATGIKGFDANIAFNAIKQTALNPARGMEFYRKYGFIPIDKDDQSVSKTLEYAYNDWCIASMAKSTGNVADFNTFYRSSQTFVNLFDKKTNFMRPRSSNGDWISNFNPLKYENFYTEANAYQYSSYVPHEVPRLMELMGGSKTLENWLDTLFTNTKGNLPTESGYIGQYWHANEPSHHMAYLYNFVGKPWKTQKIVHKILTDFYTINPDGISGNDDCGQMSAWYVFSSLGFYPSCPGQNMYLIGAPLFKKAIVNMANGKTLVINKQNASKNNIYVSSLKINGTGYNSTNIPISEVLKGGKWNFKMQKSAVNYTSEPTVTQSLGMARVANPYITSIPYTSGQGNITLDCSTPGAKIRYATNAPDSIPVWYNYDGKIKLNSNTNLCIVAVKDNHMPSDTVCRIIESLSLNKAMSPLGSLIPGLKYSYYENEISCKMPDFKNLRPLENGTEVNFNIDSIKHRNEHWQMCFDGYIKVDTTNVYLFELASDDGAILYINDKPLINNDGCHGSLSKNYAASLEKGFHKIKVEYYNGRYGANLSIFWSSNGMQPEKIPDHLLFQNIE